MDRHQVLGWLAEQEASGRAEVARWEQEALRITDLIEEGRQEIDRLATARRVLSGEVDVSTALGGGGLFGFGTGRLRAFTGWHSLRGERPGKERREQSRHRASGQRAAVQFLSSCIWWIRFGLQSGHAWMTAGRARRR